jgi:hypothetical protein
MIEVQILKVGPYPEIGPIVLTDPMHMSNGPRTGSQPRGGSGSGVISPPLLKNDGGKLLVSFSQKGFGGFDPDKGFGAGIVFGEVALMTACRSAIEREGSRMYRSEGLKKKSQSSRDLPEPH